MSYSSKSKFNAVDKIQNLKDLDDAKRVINSLMDTINNTHEKLNTEFRNLSREAGGATTVTIVNGTGGSSAGGGGTSGTTQGGKRAVSSITAPTTVTFKTAMANLNYVLWVWGFNSAGEVVGVTTSAYSTTNFKVLPLEPCDVLYIVQPYTP